MKIRQHLPIQFSILTQILFVLLLLTTSLLDILKVLKYLTPYLLKYFLFLYNFTVEHVPFYLLLNY